MTVIVAVAAWNVNKPDAHERKIMYLTTIVLVIVSLSCCKNNLRQIDADNIFKKESAAETISIEFQENSVIEVVENLNALTLLNRKKKQMSTAKSLHLQKQFQKKNKIA